VGEVKGMLAGAVWCQTKPWWSGVKLYDLEIFIKEDFRNHGFSKQLLQRILEDAISIHKVNEVEAITFNDRAFPLSYYARIELVKDDQLVLLGGKAECILKKLVGE